MHYSLAHTFGQYRAGRLDPDAKAYIAAVVATGVTVTATQRTAVDTFYKTAKDDGYYTSLKRLYLPIWGAAAANAIDMITLTSGTFAGGVTHGAGFVEGNGTTGYFDTLTAMNSIGWSNSNFGISLLVAREEQSFNSARVYSGTLTGSNYFTLTSQSTTQMRRVIFSLVTRDKTFTYGRSSHNGVLVLTRNSGKDIIYRRITSGISTVDEVTVSAAGTIPTNNIVLAGLNVDGVVSNFTNARFGCASWHLALTEPQVTSYSLALKNLWETATGLTLP